MVSDQLFTQSGLNSFQGQRLHYVSWQPGPMLHCLYGEKVFHYGWSELHWFQFIFVSYPSITCCYEELGSDIS